MCAVCVKTPRAAAVAASLVLGSALAANAGGYTPPVVDTGVVAPVIEAAPVGDWAGGYAGLTLGYAFGGDDEVGVDQPEVGTPASLEISGANAGLRLGYRWQRDRWVFGPELGYEGGKIEDSFSTGGYEAESEIKSVLALRMKTGYLTGNDILVYGIVGVARAKVDYRVEGDGDHGPIAVNDSYSKTGYIVGLGAEKKLTERLSLTGEYEYANFGKETLEDGLGASARATPDFHNVKLGLNFKF